MSPDLLRRIVELLDVAHLLEDVREVEARHWDRKALFAAPLYHVQTVLDRRLRLLAAELNHDAKLALKEKVK